MSRQAPDLPLDPILLARRIGEITGKPFPEVWERLRREQSRMGSAVRSEMARRGLRAHAWSPGLEKLYRESDAFLYELAVWNTQNLKAAQRALATAVLEEESRTSLEVLCYGDGLGFDSLALDRAGHRVTYLEPPGLTRDFAERVFADAEAPVRCVDAASELPDAGFDAVVCFEVLEHLPDPPSATAELARVLRPGGIALVSAPFGLLTPDFPTHLSSNLRYLGDFEGLFGAAGFEPAGGNPFWDPIVLRKGPFRGRRGDAYLALVSRAGGFALRLARHAPWIFSAIDANYRFWRILYLRLTGGLWPPFPKTSTLKGPRTR